ncbi:MAG: histidine kinase dimerization/phospho-acceptor domain-containing protein [Eubacteriales bacterium]|nr:histidine kinase dimerization/phospho-acceptor domain-containing protein [Eubacteriales bacterium]
MATKLKNLNKRQQEIALVSGLGFAAEAFTFGMIFIKYPSMWLWGKKEKIIYAVSGSILLLLAVAMCAGIIWQMRIYIKKYPPRETWNVHRADNIKSELLVLAALLSAGRWIQALLPYDEFIWTRYLLNTVLNIITFFGELLLVLTVLGGSIFLLARQWVLGILPKTSVIWSERIRYRNRTPLEERLQNKRKAGLLFAGILTAAAVICSYAAFMGADLPAVMMGVTAIIMLLLFYKNCFSGKSLREIGCLVQHIQKMSEGEVIPQELYLPENSLFYDTSRQLGNIDAAMRKSVEKQVQAERLKIDLITNVSHDLKTPLTSMVGYTALLKKENLSDEARDYVEVISAKQEQLKNMIQDLFELSKATSGSDQLHLETLDMRRLLEQTMGDMEDGIQESGQSIRTAFHEEPLLFTGDNAKMYRVVQNLLENALKYSMQGTRIYVEAGKRNGQVYTEVKNIASYEMDFKPDEIMERFVRGDKSRTTEGHGLGLAIASSFVRNMGGELEIMIDGDLFKVTIQFPQI